MASVLALLRQLGIAATGYLDDYLLQAETPYAMMNNVGTTIRTLQGF